VYFREFVYYFIESDVMWILLIATRILPEFQLVFSYLLLYHSSSSLIILISPFKVTCCGVY
jgi:hypothetical protein